MRLVLIGIMHACISAYVDASVRSVKHIWGAHLYVCSCGVLRAVRAPSMHPSLPCRHCWPLLELLLSHGLKALQVTDTPLAQDIFSVLGRYLPTPGACLVKLQLKDVLAGGSECRVPSGL